MSSEVAGARTAYSAAIDAIDMFMEYRDKHGHSEASARVLAAIEIAEGAIPLELAGTDNSDSPDAKKEGEGQN